MRLLKASIVLAVFVAGMGTGMLTAWQSPTEDSPGWDCTTQGDRSCSGRWDLTNPFERCLAAMEQAEIPADVWECRE